MAQNNSGHSGRKDRGSGLLRQNTSSSSSSGPKALTITFERHLRAHRGKLETGPGPGNEVFAASFLTRREIVFDTDLLAHAPDFVSIVTHEIYHFVWRRLPNAERKAWADLLTAEKRPAHTGLSSSIRYITGAARQSKDYICEAFCDTAAALTNPNKKISSQRRRYFSRLNDKRRLPV